MEQPLKLEYVDPRTLLENPKNWRTHPARQTAAVDQLIYGERGVGWVSPLIFNARTGRLVDGHDRRKIALARGADFVPVIVGDWTEAQEEKILLTLDPSSALAEWDETKLLALLRAHPEEAELVAPDDWAALLELVAAPEEEPPDAPEPPLDRAAELQEKWQVQSGDVWEIGAHRLACGDCTETAVVESVMRGERAEMVFTDPPYGIDAGKIEGDEDLSVWQNSISPTYDSMSENSFYCCFVSIENMLDIGAMLRERFEYKWQVIQYVNNGMVRAAVGFSVYIPVLIFEKGKPSMHQRIRDVRETSTSSQKMALRMHPYEKSVEFVEDIVKYATGEGDTILDPFAGSGTTAVACERLGRRARLIEIAPAYCAVILERLRQMGLAPVKLP